MSASTSFDAESGADKYLTEMAKENEIGKRIKHLRDERGGMTQTEFAAKLGKTTRGAVGNWERGLGIKRENLQAIAEKFGVSFEWLASGRGTMELPDASTLRETANALVGDRLAEQGEYIPLYGHAVGGVDGEFILNGSKLGEILAPPGLSVARGAYAVGVVGESMEPRYFDGETVFVDPRRRVGKGDFVVAQIQYEEHGPIMAFVKRFVRRNSVELVLEQFNPAKELRFPASAVISIHYIVLGGRAT